MTGWPIWVFRNRLVLESGGFRRANSSCYFVIQGVRFIRGLVGSSFFGDFSRFGVVLSFISKCLRIRVYTGKGLRSRAQPRLCPSRYPDLSNVPESTPAHHPNLSPAGDGDRQRLGRLELLRLLQGFLCHFFLPLICPSGAMFSYMQLLRHCPSLEVSS